MTSPLVALITFVVFAVSFVPLAKWFIRRRRYVAAVDAIPGPKAYPLIGTAYLFFGVKRHEIFPLIQRLIADYPEISRSWLGPVGQVELRRAQHMDKILNNTKSHLEKGWTYGFVRPWLGDGLLTSTGDKWHERRKILTPAFHFSILESFCEVFDEKSRVLVDKLRPFAESGEEFQLYPFVTRAALDIIAEAAMGTKVHAQDDADNAYVAAVYDSAELIVRRLLRPWLHPDFIYRWSSDGKKFAECLGTMHAFTNGVIRSRREARKVSKTKADQSKRSASVDQIKKRHAFLDLLLEQSDNPANGLSDEDIREEVGTFMFEGHDTTTSGIAWALFLLGLHPQIQDDVYNEVNGIFDGSDRGVTIADLNQMHLLDRVIKETLRLYPPVPIIGRKLSEPVQLDEQHWLPKGCQVSIELFDMHRDPKHFPDPHRFDPDRFLPENTVGRNPFAYLPFSAGSRNCIGQKFAIYEEKTVISTILRSYRLCTLGKEEDEEQIQELITKPRHGIRMKLERR